MAALFELDGVSKCFGLVDVGEALAVIGPNGARATDPVQPDHLRPRPETGRILFAVADITTLAPQARSRLGIGRTYQIPHPFANMTVFENLLVGAIFGARQSEREIYDRCAELLELDQVLLQLQRFEKWSFMRFGKVAWRCRSQAAVDRRHSRESILFYPCRISGSESNLHTIPKRASRAAWIAPIVGLKKCMSM